MKNMLICLIFLPAAMISSCKPEPETVLVIEVRNETTNFIRIKSYGTLSTGIDTVLFEIASGESIKQHISTRGGSDFYPQSLHDSSYFRDSSHVFFNDTLLVRHFDRVTSYISENSDSTIIFYSNERNLYNSQSYIQEKVKDDVYKGTFVFTQHDLDYAIEVNE